MPLDNRTDDVKPEAQARPRATLLLDLRDAVEALPDVALLLGRESRSVVANQDAREVMLPRLLL